jgi:hypothetical protein
VQLTHTLTHTRTHTTIHIIPHFQKISLESQLQERRKGQRVRIGIRPWERTNIIRFCEKNRGVEEIWWKNKSINEKKKERERHTQKENYYWNLEQNKSSFPNYGLLMKCFCFVSINKPGWDLPNTFSHMNFVQTAMISLDLFHLYLILSVFSTKNRRGKILSLLL